jgi:hypothetical protein
MRTEHNVLTYELSADLPSANLPTASSVRSARIKKKIRYDPRGTRCYICGALDFI